MGDIVIGADAGGTSTRVAVATPAGEWLATAEGGGANPTTHGPDAAARELGGVVRRALAGLEARDVRAVVVGIAGRATLDDPAVADLFAQAVGVPVRPVFVADTEVAFCSATPAPDGTVLVAGTGAMAVGIRDRTSARTSDGLGWLLGDEGSAFWLGRAAVRASIADLCRTGPATALTAAVANHLLETPPGGGPAGRSALIRAVAARPPIALAELAPLVTAAASAGDAVAGLICDDAAGRLVRLVRDVREPGEETPIVLHGSVVRDPGSPIGRRVRDLLAKRADEAAANDVPASDVPASDVPASDVPAGDVPAGDAVAGDVPAGDVVAAADGVVGAAWLAVRGMRPGWAEDRLAEVHARLRSGAA
ncbi:N-acetylglucosamine kinase [Actinoplanes sp. RD1]|uniref:N-acetylglucosamine kinase n=1 Tax=Actinoplanes sp. RD1 TaxID=3064538 RepID=UPI002742591B|nr:BadF/BadG/BcrA/BcrD ATPase family protein [Actinoplanes sp. RD1]